MDLISTGESEFSGERSSESRDPLSPEGVCSIYSSVICLGEAAKGSMRSYSSAALSLSALIYS